MASPYDEILTHLQANVSSTFAPIRYVDNIAEMRTAPLDGKAALLISPVGLAAVPTNTTVGAVTQNMTVRIAFWLVYQGGNDGDTAEKFPMLYEALRTALLGFAPNQYYDPMIFEEGEAVALGENGYFAWQEVYATSTSIRQA